MKIAIDARSIEKEKTGIGRYLLNLIKYWEKTGENNFTLYFKDEIPDLGFLKNSNFNLKLIENPLGFSSNFLFQHFLLPIQLKKDKVDFFFSPFYLKPVFCPVKNSIVLHDISYEAHPEWFDRKSNIILRWFSKISAKTTDIIFTVSDYSKKEIKKYYKIDSEKIIVANLAVDGDFKKAEDAKANAIKEKYKIDKFIFCIGSIFSRRHIPEVIEAFEKFARKHKEYQMLIVGKNHTYPFVDIKEKIKAVNEKAGREVIKHFDFVKEEDLIGLYSSCEICVYLSDYEGFGLPIIEAQFFGKPVLTSYNSSLIEVGGDSVEFVKNNTSDEIYESFEKIIFDDTYKKELKEKGGENFKRFSWEKCANKILSEILAYEKSGKK